MTAGSESIGQDRQARLDLALAEYLSRIDQGDTVNPESWLARHPDLAEELRSYLDAVGEINTLARRAFDPTGHHVVDSSSQPELIKYLGDYEIISEIARGGMGVVYRSRQISLNRIVAVKMILAGRLASQDAVERFRSEAKAAASLRHANIVAIFEIGEHEGQQYYSMEFVEGTSLAELVRVAPLTPETAARYLQKVALAIAYSHCEGILHRDLKPSNILIDGNDEPRVTDFGLAKCLESDAGLTSTGQILGTPSYMPPEQASQNRGNLSPASDVYSLGAILYELLCGRPPFRSATAMETLLQVLEMTPVSPRLVNPTIPCELETIALKCLDKDPAKRYGSAEALADELGRWLEGKPILARPAGPLERLGKWVRRQPTIAALAMLVMIVSSIGLSAFVYQFTLTITARNDAMRAADQERAARRQAERNYYFSQVAVAQNEWERNDLDQAREKLASVAAEQRDWEWHYLNHIAKAPRAIPLLRTAAYRPFHENEIAGVVYMTQELPLLAGKKDRSLHGEMVGIVDRRTGVVRKTFSDEVAETQSRQTYTRPFAFSPDGNVIVTARSQQHDTTSPPTLIQMWNANTGQKLFELDRAQTLGEVEAVAFHPNGTQFATSHYQRDPNRTGFVKLWDAASGQLLQSLESNWTRLLRFHPHKSWLANQQYVWDLETSNVIRDFSSDTSGPFLFVAWSPDGELMAVVPSKIRTVINLMETETGRVRQMLHGHTHPVAIDAVAFSPDGKWLASGTDENHSQGEIKLWDVATGTEVRSIRGATSRVDALAFHLHEPELAVVSYPETFFVDPGQNQEATVIPLLQQREWETGFVWFTSDSQLVITANGDGSQDRDSSMCEPMQLTARNASTGQDVWTLQSEKGPLAMSPNSSLIAFIAKDGIHVVDATTGHLVRVLPEMVASRIEIAGRSTVSSARMSMLAFDPSGQYLAGRTVIPELTNSTIVWDVQSGRVLSPPEGWGVNIKSDTFDSGCILFKAGARQQPGWSTSAFVFEQNRFVRAEGREIVVRDAEMFRVERRFGPFAGHVEGISFSNDRSKIVGQAGHEIRVWEFTTGHEANVPVGIEPFTGLAFGCMGERLVISGESEELSIITKESKSVSTTMTTTVRFRYGNGRHIDNLRRWGVIMDGGSNPATVLDLTTGEKKIIGSKSSRVMSCAFFPGGRRLATGNDDGIVQIWDTETWTAVLTLPAHERGVISIAVSPDSGRLATIGWDGKLKIWGFEPVGSSSRTY